MSRKFRPRRPFKNSALEADPGMRERFEAEKRRHLAERRAAEALEGPDGHEIAEPAAAAAFDGLQAPGGADPRPADAASASAGRAQQPGAGASSAGSVPSAGSGPSAGGAAAPAAAEARSAQPRDGQSDRAGGALEGASTPQRLSIAVVAMGGQGGGVLSDWLIALAQGCGWRVQATSVPGVAQRTGATIYYIEMFRGPAGAEPVLAMMPLSGDVDLVVAAEWMEAGRAILRGLVTPDRTTLVASTHRSYATVEKIVPGNGMADSAVVSRAARDAAAKLLAFDMAELAESHGSVISAALFGAIAGSGALPFPLSAFEDAVRASGVGVEASLATLQAAYSKGQAQLAPADGLRAGAPHAIDPADGAHEASSVDGDGAPAGVDTASDGTGLAEAGSLAADDGDARPQAGGDAPVATPQGGAARPVPLQPAAGPAVVLPTGPFGRRIASVLPVAAHAMAVEGLRRCVDYLDADYGREYLDRIERCLGADTGGAQQAAAPDDAPAESSVRVPPADPALEAELALELSRWLALRMCYEDPIRVADLKIRRKRFDAIRQEVRAEASQPIEHDEFLHPRMQEVLDTVPENWAAFIERHGWLRTTIDRRVSRGQLLRSSRLRGFLPLAWLAGRHEWRRRSRRHARETAMIDDWLAKVRRLRSQNPALAVAMVRTARLVKGYSDTHARSIETHDRVCAVVDSLVQRPEGGAILDYLIEAALADADGRELDAALAELARVNGAHVPAAAAAGS